MHLNRSLKCLPMPLAKTNAIFIYNAFSHIHSQWDMIERECKRVLKITGKIYIVGTWKLDTNLMTDLFGDHAVQYGSFLVVKMMK